MNPVVAENSAPIRKATDRPMRTTNTEWMCVCTGRNSSTINRTAPNAPSVRNWRLRYAKHRMEKRQSTKLGTAARLDRAGHFNAA